MPSLPRLYAILDVDTVTARGLEPRAVVHAWLAAGVRLIQLRAKHLASGEFLALATDLVAQARAGSARGAEPTEQRRATILINDRADIALMSGADGVHVGQDDLRPSDIRSLVGRSFSSGSPGQRVGRSFSSGSPGQRVGRSFSSGSPGLKRRPTDGSGPTEGAEGMAVGVSTHNVEQLRAALGEPADYFAIGPVFPTSSKAGADPVVGLAGVRAAAELLAGDGRPLVAIGGVTLENMADIFAAGASSVAVISDLLVGAPEARAREYVNRVGVD